MRRCIQPPLLCGISQAATLSSSSDSEASATGDGLPLQVSWLAYLPIGDSLTVAFTVDVYSHIISDMQEDGMALLDEVLPEGVSGTRAARPRFSIVRASVAQW